MTKRIRHIKRGSTYEVVGEALMQVSRPTGITEHGICRPIYDGQKLVLYRAEDGMMFVRFPDEMTDGRFVDVDDVGPD